MCCAIVAEDGQREILVQGVYLRTLSIPRTQSAQPMISGCHFIGHFVQPYILPDLEGRTAARRANFLGLGSVWRLSPRAYVFTRRRFSPCMGCHKYWGLQTRIGCLTGRTIADLMRATHLDRPQNERDMEGRSLQILCTYTERPGE